MNIVQVKLEKHGWGVTKVRKAPTDNEKHLPESGFGDLGMVWGWFGKVLERCSEATGQNEVGPADRAQRSAALPKGVQGVLDTKNCSC